MLDREGIDETPASAAYRELAEFEAERLYGSIALLLGDTAAAEQVALGAWRRTWRAYDRGQILGDAEEVLYRSGIRAALNRLARSREFRGYQPATTEDDRLITAAGILSAISPQQRAGVILSVWGGLEPRLAAVASAITEERVMEGAFAARQEYREARGAPKPTTPACHELGPLLSAQLDGTASRGDDQRVSEHLAGCEVCQQARFAYEEFGAVLRGIRISVPGPSPADAALAVPQEAGRPVGGLRRLLRLAMGPGVLVVFLVLVLVLIGDCGEPAVKTGAGRTSDIIFAREPGATIVLDSGTGRELGRLDAGALTSSGDRLYGARRGCGGRSDATAIWVGDLGTLEKSDIGCAEGQLVPVGVEAEQGRLYLADEGASWERLVLFDLEARRLTGSEVRAEAATQGFAPELAAVTADRSFLFTVGFSSGAEPGAVVVRTDLRSFEIDRVTPMPSLAGSRVALLASASGSRVWVYDVDGGRVVEVDSARQGVGRTAVLGAGGNPQVGGGSENLVAHQGALAAGLGESEIFAILPAGGIVVLSLERFEVERHLNPDRRYTAVAASSDGRSLFALESDETYVVLDASTGAQVLRRARVKGKEFLQVNAGV